MSHRIEIPDPSLPRPGERAGEGADSLLPFLKQRRTGRPRLPNEFLATDPESGSGETGEGEPSEDPAGG